MKKATLPAVLFFIAVVAFCCKTYHRASVDPGAVHTKTKPAPPGGPLRDCNGVYYGTHARTTDTVAAQAPHETIDPGKQPAAAPGAGKAEAPAKQTILQKQFPETNIRKVLRKAGDDDGAGLAIGLVVLVVLVLVLLLVGLIYVIAVGTSNASANSGSGSTSGNGNGGSGSGCYIATMVYGSYEAPEVRVLRRFRDETLAHSAAGRAFIRWYYGWSPGFVKKYQHLRWLHRLIRAVLDRFVRFLAR